MIKDKITPELRNRFKEAIKRTTQTRKEHGFVICKDEKGNLIPTEICIGKECGIEIKGKCRYKTEGYFHVHPQKGIFLPSHTDILNGLLDKCESKSEGTVCIGASEEMDKIDCWTLKKITRLHCNKAKEEAKEKLEFNIPKAWIWKLYTLNEINLKNINKE